MAVGLRSSYRIIIRSFIAAPFVQFGPSKFLGDGRKPTAEVSDAVGFRAIQDIELALDRGSSKLQLYEQTSSATVGVIPRPFYLGAPAWVPVDNAHTQHTLSPIRRTRASTSGRITNSFATSYWAQDPVTPRLLTPALDVHTQFSLTAYQESGVMRVQVKVTGDLFPSVEVIMVNPAFSGKNILLGAHMEEGGLPDLFFDNRRPLLNVDVDLVLDREGGFTEVRKGFIPHLIRTWNQKVIDNACRLSR